MPWLQAITVDKAYLPKIAVTEVCLTENYILKGNVFKIAGGETGIYNIAIPENAVLEG
jgi:hypothetical protein